MMTSTLIPKNATGKQNDLSHTVTLNDVTTARLRFMEACNRLLFPAGWHKLSGALSAEFTITDSKGRDDQRPARVNDHIRIDIPGPGSISGDGYDWVCVEAAGANVADDADESCGIRLRSCQNPKNKGGDVAHFFKGSATSTFIICRKGTTVTASYHGRNEVPNTNTTHIMENVRNAVITSGALAGLSEMQWHSLIKAFLEE